MLGQSKAKNEQLCNVTEYRCYRNFSQEDFISMLQNLPFDAILNDHNLNHAWQSWHDLYMKAVNEHAPLKRKRMRSKLCPWINGDLIEAMNKRDWYHKMATKPNNPERTEFWAKYKSLRNEISSLIRNAKNDYISTLLQENGGTPNAMWKTLKLISSTKKESLTKLEVDGEDVTDSQEIAQHFNDYFVNSVNTMFNPLNFDICGNNSETSTSERDNDENLINDNESNISTL